MLKSICLIDAKLATTQGAIINSTSLDTICISMHMNHLSYYQFSVTYSFKIEERVTQMSDLYRKPLIFCRHQRTEAEGHLETAAGECIAHAKEHSS